MLYSKNRNNNIRISEYKYVKEIKEVELVIDGKLYKELKVVSQKEGITLNAIINISINQNIN